MSETKSRTSRLGRLADPAFVRFLFTGVLNTAFGYGTFYLLLAVGLPPEIALLGATVAGVTFNFMMTSRLVFRRRGSGFPSFIAVYAAIYVLNAGALRLMIAAGIPAALSQALLLPPFAVLTYLILRTFVFAHQGN